MIYRVDYVDRAVHDLADLPRDVTRCVVGKLERMTDDLAGDVKRLTDYAPRYRLRVGDYRVLFDVDGDRIVVYRVLHRREAYDR